MADKRGGNYNPTGKGGFGDNPQNRSDGRWGPDNSFSYWMNYFKSLSTKELLAWEENTPEDKRSVAADLAYARVVKARKDLKEFQEVASRTEGRPKEFIDMTSGGEKISGVHDDIKAIAEAIKDANQGSKPDNAPESNGPSVPAEPSEEVS